MTTSAAEESKVIAITEDTKSWKKNTKIINAKNITIIPNSRAEHSIYTYSTRVDTHFDIKDASFFNPIYTFAMVGDIIRVFRYNQDELAMYYEFIVTKVDKICKKVEVVALTEKNLKKKDK